jgi:hypothetical protein
MIQVGELYRNDWGGIVKVTEIRERYVFLELADRPLFIGVKEIENFLEYYTKLSSLEQELL